MLKCYFVLSSFTLVVLVRLTQSYFKGISQACPILLWCFWSGFPSLTLAVLVRLAKCYFVLSSFTLVVLGQACSVLLWWYWSGLLSLTLVVLIRLVQLYFSVDKSTIQLLSFWFSFKS